MCAANLNAWQLLDEHTSPTFILDQSGRVAKWNRACERLTGVKAADVLGTTDHWRGFYEEARPCLADLLLSDKIEEIDLRYFAISDLPGNADELIAESWCVLPIIGGLHYLSIEAVRIRDASGAVIAVLETLRDLSAAKEAEARLKDLAGIDFLTRLANRRAFDALLSSAWRRAVRHRKSISILMIDIDHFKHFNDRFGHLRGDACLKAVAEALAENCRRPGDALARFGGEEFVVVLADTDGIGAGVVAENIRGAVERLDFCASGRREGDAVTVSIGVATATPDGADGAEKLVGFADYALFRAKELGRNRVCHFDNDSGLPTAGR